MQLTDPVGGPGALNLGPPPEWHLWVLVGLAVVMFVVKVVVMWRGGNE